MKSSELTSLKSQLRESQNLVIEKTRLLARKSKELDENKLNVEAQLAAVERKLGDESSLFRRRAAEADKSAKDLELAGNVEDQRTQLLVGHIKEKNATTIGQLEAKIREEIETNRKLVGHSR